MADTRYFTMKDLYEKHDKLGEGEVILDVRTPEEFHSGHVPGAINISHDQIDQHVEELKKYKKVYMHCRSGGRVGVAMEMLANSGLTNLVCITMGGMLDWVEQGFPLEKS